MLFASLGREEIWRDNKAEKWREMERAPADDQFISGEGELAEGLEWREGLREVDYH